MYVDGVLSDEIQGRPPVFVCWFKCRLLATLIAGNVFGDDWFEEILAADNRPSYFQIDLRSENTFPRSTTRVIEVGEMVWNLHQVDGFAERASEIRTAGRGVEGKIGELMGGRFFRQHGIMFAFRRPTGIKQDDYDIDYVRTDSRMGRCEVKCKLQQTEFSVNTVMNSLKEAKKQLPKDEGGIILFRSPEDWVPFQDGVSKLQAIIDAVNNWFQAEKTTRVRSVVLFDSRTDVDESFVRTNCYYKEYKNPYCADSSGLPGYLSNAPAHTTIPSNWTRIPELVEAWEPRR
jgi:hypothetical protein